MTAVLAIDQGTTSSRAIVFDPQGRPLASAGRPLVCRYPHPGWVEQDAEEIWDGVVESARQALSEAGMAATDLTAVGVTNQRETTLLWDRATGKALAPAIVWQDRRTADACEALRAQGAEDRVGALTGLLLDPYFSATKLAWLLDHVEGARAAAEDGRLAFGTVDSFLLWRLTGGERHATDVTNASRTMLLDIHDQTWSDELLAMFGVPRAVLPEVLDCAADFGTVTADILGAEVPIRGVAGDQQAAAFGQACFEPGMLKCTYGTGAFALLHTGVAALRSTNRLLGTIGYRLGGETSYALEGSIFSAGSVVQWMRDELKLFGDAAESEGLARSASGGHGVYLVPAFTGLGAPYWDPHARGALFGMTRDTNAADIVRAGLESVGFQTRDLLTALAADGAAAPTTLRVDGGMVANDWMAQFLADILDLPVERPQVTETTALGAAWLAGLGSGLQTSLDDISQRWSRERRFEPTMSEDERLSRYDGWRTAVSRVRVDASNP